MAGGEPRLIPLDRVSDEAETALKLGPSAVELARALRADVPVLDTHVLPARVFHAVVRESLPPAHDLQSLIRGITKPHGVERAARAHERLLETPLDDELLAELTELWERVREDAPWGLAVRACPALHDDAIAMAAGLNEAVLGVRGTDELVRAIRRVWASSVSEGALRYLRARRVRELGLSVLIQRLVPAHASGRMLLREPVPGDETERGEPRYSEARAVSATLGLGARVVDGTAARDIMRFARDGRVLDRAIASKRYRLVADEQPSFEKVGRPERYRAALDDADIAGLADISRRLESAAPAKPLVVDFVRARDGRLWIQEVRHAAGLTYPEGGDAATIWSRAGLTEELPGVPTPLTRSLAEQFVANGFAHAFDTLGCKVPRGTSFVGSVRGRLYFDTSALMRVAAQFPALDARQLMSLAGSDAAEALSRGSVPVRTAAWARLPFTVASLVRQRGKLEEEMTDFEQEAELARSWLSEMDLAILPDDALATTLQQVRGLFIRTGELMLTGTAVSLASYVALKTVLARSARAAGGDPVLTAERVAEAITAGAGDLESARPAMALAHVAAIVRGDAAACAALAGRKVRSLDELPEGPGVRAIRHFLGAYGDRALREAELAAPRWAEDPRPVLYMLGAAAAREPLDPDAALSRARAVADRELALVETRLPFVERTMARVLVSRCRDLVRLRSRTRVWLTRTLDMLRTVVLDVDRRLRRIDPGLPEGAAFYLSYEELVGSVKRSRGDLSALVRLRRFEYERDETRPGPPRTFVGAPPFMALPPPSARRLTGLAGSGGVVTGRARLIGPRASGAERLEPGDVLVTRVPDTALSPLFLLAGAVVTELGGPLADAALVAREFGVPAVVGVPGVAETVGDGDLLRVDGDRGIVERLEVHVSEPPSAS